MTSMTSIGPCATCPVRNRSLCGALDDRALAGLRRISIRRRFARGEILALAGDATGYCANLLDGAIKLTAATHDGREQIVGLLHPADFVGRPDGGPTPFTMTALTATRLCAFPSARFGDLLDDQGAIPREVLRRTAAALDEARARMLGLARRSAAEKVAGFLLDMARRAPDACRAAAAAPVTFDLALTRGEIAGLLGLTIETVSRQMTRLKASGIVALPTVRSVTIRDAGALQAQAEGAADA